MKNLYIMKDKENLYLAAPLRGRIYNPAKKYIGHLHLI